MSDSIKNIEKLGFPWKTMDPFLFCVHHADAYPKGESNYGPDPNFLQGRNIGNDFTLKDGWRMYHGDSVPGFPVHPHRGFETVTINKQGFVDHADSLGAAGRFSAGDVQWMTAGKGIQHSEMFPLLNQKEDNPLEIFQIWINLPKKSKFVDPYFKMLWKEDIPVIQIHDDEKRKSLIHVISGDYLDAAAPSSTPDSWAAVPGNEVAIWTIEIEANAKLELPIASPEANRVIYFYQGEKLIIDEQNIPGHHLIELNANQKTQVKNGDEPAFLILLQGKPINEPVVQYGPFVMNTQAEIQQAFSDYQQTQFGGWPWSRNDQIHNPKKGRFALHADGTIETKK